jgi:hypothetical protein
LAGTGFKASTQGAHAAAHMEGSTPGKAASCTPKIIEFIKRKVFSRLTQQDSHISGTIRYFGRHAEITEMPLRGWLVNVEERIPCPCHYFSKWGYCVHYVAACEMLGVEYQGHNPRAVKIMDTRVKQATRRKKNVAKGNQVREEADAATRGTARTRASSKGKLRGTRGKPRGRKGGRGKFVGSAYKFY